MHDSSTSTTISNTSDLSLENILKQDSIRYKRKGFGLIFAFLLTLIYFIVVPLFLKEFWNHYFELMENKKLLFTIVNITLHSTMFIVCNSMMCIIYKVKLPFFDRYKVNPLNKWPWESNSKEWNEVLKKTIKNLAISHLILMPTIQLGSYYTGGVVYKMSREEFPDIWENCKHIVFFMICEDFFFYWIHKIAHLPFFYQKIHKIHHEYKITISLASEYAHPLEFIFANVFPTSVGFLIMGKYAHASTIFMWISLRIFETIDGHCGYEFSWSPYRLLPLSGAAEYHNYHHTHNVGNFGSFFTVWDTLLGTNKAYYQHLQKQKKRRDIILKPNHKKQILTSNLDE